jgi:excisionase family DNA binding protein
MQNQLMAHLPHDLLMTVAEFAERTRWHPVTVRKKIAAGEIETLRPGPRSTRITGAEFNRIMFSVR